MASEEMNWKRSTGTIAAVCLLFAGQAQFKNAPLITEKASFALDGGEAGSPASIPSISGNGRFVAYESSAYDMVEGDANGRADIFVRDMWTGGAIIVSLASDGTQANYNCERSCISSDGRRVAFRSEASNLVPDDTNGVADIFVHDIPTRTTRRVSVASDGAQANGESPNARQPSITPDGRYVVFACYATNLVQGDANGVGDLFRHDLQTGITELVTLATDGTQANDRSHDSTISADGRYIAFCSNASNLVPGDTNDADDVFLRDMVAAVTTRISVASDESQGGFNSINPSMSADARYIAFESNSTFGDGQDQNGIDMDVFVRDIVAGTTTLVSVSNGIQSENETRMGHNNAISADGRYVTFYTFGDVWLPIEQQGEYHKIWRHDRVAHTVTLVSVSSSGAVANDTSHVNSISADGRYIVFFSSATNLTVPPDETWPGDIFVRGPVWPKRVPRP